MGNLTDAAYDAKLIRDCAEKILGLRVHTSGRGSTIASDQDGDNERILATTHPWELATWNPLTADADAFEVVDAMDRRGFWFKLTSPFDTEHRQWCAGFCPHSTTGWNGVMDAAAADPDRRRAIVLASLAAIGAENAD